MGRLIVLFVMAFAIIPTACDRSPSMPDKPTTAGANTPSTPSDVIREILKTRKSAQYSALRELVLPDRAEPITRTLLAVDDFLAANQKLCDQIRERVGPGVSARVDQSHLADHLDVFSRYVDLIGEVVDGDSAIVRFTIDGKLPAKSAQLLRIDGRWRYDPGPGYSAGLVAAFEKMTEGLRQLADELRSGALNVDPFRENPDRLLEEVRLRLLPGVKMLPGPAR